MRRAGRACAAPSSTCPRLATRAAWFTGPGEGGLESAYFVLEDYYTPRETRYVAVREKALHTKWTTDEAMCHELAELQNVFFGYSIALPVGGRAGVAAMLVSGTPAPAPSNGTPALFAWARTAASSSDAWLSLHLRQS